MNQVRKKYSDSIKPEFLAELGQGAEGQVFEMTDTPGVVYKEFFVVSSSPPNLAALEKLIEVSRSMNAADKQWTEERVLTPTDAIVHNGKLRGYLMKKISPNFYCLHGVKARPKTVPCDWNFLSMRKSFASNKNLVSQVPVLSTVQVLKLLLDLAETIEILHRYDIILGDISGRNLLWTSSPELRVLLIDCDGFRVRGMGSVNYPKQTPDWIDSTISNNLTNQSSDIYKLGLAAYRSVWNHPTNAPPVNLSQPINESQNLSVLIRLINESYSESDRPIASDWVSGLRDCLTSVQFEKTPPKSTSQIVKPIPPKPTRPTISMKQKND